MGLKLSGLRVCFECCLSMRRWNEPSQILSRDAPPDAAEPTPLPRRHRGTRQIIHISLRFLPHKMKRCGCATCMMG